MSIAYVSTRETNENNPHNNSHDGVRKWGEKKYWKRVKHIYGLTLYPSVPCRRMETLVLLHNIRSAHNVGSIFRTADGAGVKKILLSGYTPTPVDRFGRENTEILKTSLGATHTVPYEIIEDLPTYLQKKKSEGYTVIAIEQTKDALVYSSYNYPEKIICIFGNEITGVEPEILAQADVAVHIPMHGMKESLNVSVCAGVVLFHSRSV